eukprot:5592481-Alexandrium_andersonii.AAC.2
MLCLVVCASLCPSVSVSLGVCYECACVCPRRCQCQCVGVCVCVLPGFILQACPCRGGTSVVWGSSSCMCHPSSGALGAGWPLALGLRASPWPRPQRTAQ